MNTGFLGPAVATVLTVYGIETALLIALQVSFGLQQCLPFTVLKLLALYLKRLQLSCNSAYRLRY